MSNPAKVFIFIAILAIVYGSKRESELYKSLLSSYHSLVRPAIDPSKPVTVAMKVFLQQIINVDEKDQVIEVNAWLQFKWNDYRLRWYPSQFENISSVRFSSEDGPLWRPDVLLYNSADEQFDSTFKSNMVVYSTGEVNWIPPGIFKVSCKMDITWFPFDHQTCFMKFGSWSYDGTAIDLRIDTEDSAGESMDLSTYVSNGEWLLLDAPAILEKQYYACCEEPYPTIKFYLYIKRRTLFYAFNLIIPSLLISLMTLMCFCLPAHDMAEKIGYQTTILLSVCFFLTVLSEMTPNTSEALPLIGIFFSTVTLIISVSTAFTISVLSLRYRQPANHRMTKGMRYVFIDFLPWLLMMRRPGHLFHKGKPIAATCKFATECVQCLKQTREESVESEELESSKDPLLDVLTATPQEQLGLNRKVGDGLFSSKRSQSMESQRSTQVEKYARNCADASSSDGDVTNYLSQIVDYYMAIHAQLRKINDDMEKKEMLQDVHEEWKFAAMSLDRLCLIVFTVFLTCSISMIFYTAPYLDA